MIKNLFFDTDCLSAFLWINNTHLLHDLYGGRIILPEPVYQELPNPCIPHIKRQVETMISRKDARVQTMNVGSNEYNLYTSLIHDKTGKCIGRGEASAISLAKVYNGILASNNYRDIQKYIKKYSLMHIDTGHILLEALTKNLISESDGNHIWSNMLSKRRILPANSFSEYLENQRIGV